MASVSKNKNQKVFVGLSGGVDSSVTATILKQQGYDVVGVFIRTWQPDFIECNFREDRLDAMRVATHLDIPFLECDAEKEYKTAVADYMIGEYKIGRTPNPDVMCNREIKFGVFWNFAKSHGADFIATGHYAQIENEKNKKTGAENFKLKIANDPSKDQAYFLYRLHSADLEHVMFPIGHLKKTEVRKLAEKFKLPTAIKKDSQGVCMLGDLDLKQFLSHYIPQKRGDVLNESGEVVGYHDGATFLTLGERHGFTITQKTPNDGRYYIVAKDILHNTITVSQKNDDIKSKPKNKNESNIFEIKNCSWVSEIPTKEKKYTAQIRYHGEFLPCSVAEIKNDTVSIEFDKPTVIASGQSIVLYENKICLGGGIV